MSDAHTLFQSELRSVVREVREAEAPPSDRARKRTVVRLWLPLTPLWILLAPFALVAAPLILIYPPARSVSPWVTAWRVGAVLLSMSGTQCDVDSAGALIHIRLY